MYYCQPPQEPPQAGMGVFPIAIAAAAIPAATGLFSSFFGGGKAEKAQKAAVEAQIRAEKQMAVTAIESQRRAETVNALTFGAASAVVIAGMFVFFALRRKS